MINLLRALGIVANWFIEAWEQWWRAERNLTDDELITVWETTIAGVRDGTLPTFGDATSLREHILRRFGY